MKLLVLAVVLVIGVVGVLSEEQYTTKYDNINLDEILANDRLTGKYIDCCLDKIPCSKDGEVLKSHITDALQTGCSKCNEKQVVAVKKVLRHLHSNKKTWWDALIAKYDPDGKYSEKYSHWIA